MAKPKATPVRADDRIGDILSKMKGAGLKRGSDELLSDVEYYVSTQLAMVDYIIGRPGVPSGKVTSIIGREGSGKSTLGFHIMAQTQQQGGIAVLVDTEQRFPKGRADLIGINEADALIIEGLTLEESFEKIEELVEVLKKNYAGVPVFFIYDSIAGAVPQKLWDAEMEAVGEGKVMAPTAKFVSAVLKRLKMKMAGADMGLVLMNQLRTRIGGLDPRNPSSYERAKVMGASQTMIAEWPIIYESALILFVNSASNTGKDKNAPTGLKSHVIGRKNGLAPREMWRCDINIDYRTGGDKVGSKFDLLKLLGYLRDKGSGWHELLGAGEPSFQKANFGKVLTQHPELDLLIAEAPTLWLNDTTDVEAPGEIDVPDMFDEAEAV